MDSARPPPPSKRYEHRGEAPVQVPAARAAASSGRGHFARPGARARDQPLVGPRAGGFEAWYRVGARVYQVASHEWNSTRRRVRGDVVDRRRRVPVGRAAARGGRSRAGRHRSRSRGSERQATPEVGHLPGAPSRARSRPDGATGSSVTKLVPAVLDAAASRGRRAPPRGSCARSERKVTLEALRRGQEERRGRHGVVLPARLLALAAGGAVSRPSGSPMPRCGWREIVGLGWTCR